MCAGVIKCRVNVVSLHLTRKRKIPAVDWFVCKPCREYFKSAKSYDNHKLTVHATEQVGNPSFGPNTSSLQNTTEDSNAASSSDPLKDCDQGSVVNPDKDEVASGDRRNVNSKPVRSSRLRVKQDIEIQKDDSSRNVYAKQYTRTSRRSSINSTPIELIKVSPDVLSKLKPCSVVLRIKPELKRERNEETSRQLKFGCKFCGVYFMTNDHLLLHERMHFDQTSFECYICNKRFRLRFMLNCHLQAHLASTPFSCNVPPNGILHRQSLSLISNPSNQEDCESDQENASASLSVPIAVSNPMVLDPSRPHVCSVCGKAFSSKFGVNRHMISHSGERAFRCEECGKAYKLKEHLKQHAITHTRFSCNICTKSFKKKSFLLSHQRNHSKRVSGENHFVCKICGKIFTRVAILMRHQRRIHG